MFNKFKVFLFVSLFFLISTPVTAALLMPFQVGTVTEYRRSDNNGDYWTVQWEILEEVTLGSKQYFHIRMWNYRPGEIRDVYVRLTDTATYTWIGDGEELSLQIGPVGTKWNNGEDITEIVAIEPVTVPYGGPYTAYVNRKHKLSGSPYWYEYVVPGLGVVKEVDYYTDNAPKIQELIRICYDGAANFTADPLSGAASLTVNFTDQSCGTITSWSWDFGDESTSSEQNPSHTYKNPGTYTVSLTVVGPGGSYIKAEVDFISVLPGTQKAMPWIPLLLLDE